MIRDSSILSVKLPTQHLVAKGAVGILWLCALSGTLLVSAKLSAEMALRPIPPLERSVELESRVAVERAAQFLVEQQQDSGAWSNSPVLTALTLAALAQVPDARSGETAEAIRRATDALRAEEPLATPDQTDGGRAPPGPQGDEPPAGLSEEARMVLKIMSVLDNQDGSRNAWQREISRRNGVPEETVAAIATAIQVRQCLRATRPLATLRGRFAWMRDTVAAPPTATFSRAACRDFLYRLGRALAAVQNDLRERSPKRNWRMQTAEALLSAQKGDGSWRAPKTAKKMAAENVSATAFALLVFGQIMP